MPSSREISSPVRAGSSNGPKKSRQDTFGPYCLLYTIGEGEFAKVKYAIHNDSRKEVIFQ
jgi:hypothetical protein